MVAASHSSVEGRLGGGDITADLASLRKSEAWLLALVEGMPQMIWRSVRLGSWTWSSPQWARYTGQTSDDSCGSGWLDPVHPDDRDTALAAWQAAPAAGEFLTELRIRGLNGGYRWFQTRGKPVRDESGFVLEWIGTSTDVNDLRQLQSQQKVMVAELQHRTRNLVNRRPKRTPYRRPKGTPFVERRDGYGERAVRAGCGVGRA